MNEIGVFVNSLRIVNYRNSCLFVGIDDSTETEDERVAAAARAGPSSSGTANVPYILSKHANFESFVWNVHCSRVVFLTVKKCF